MNVETLDRFHQAFGLLAGRLPGARLPWLQGARRCAFEQFAALGFPTTRQEDWKYTNVATIERRPLHFMTEGANDVSADRIKEWVIDSSSHLLVFVDGRYVPARSNIERMPDGAFVGTVAQALHTMPELLEAVVSARPAAHGFAALNAAFFTDGFVVALPRDTAIEEPIHALFITGEADLAVQAFNVVLAGARSRCTIVEHFAGLNDASYLTNVATRIEVEEDAVVEHYRLQQEGTKACHIASIDAAQQRASRFASHAFAFGSALSRTGIGVSLNAEDAQATLNGLYLVGGRQHVDHHTRIDHAKPRGTSREYYRGVLDGAARGVFNGKVVVHPDAQKTDTHQANHNLLLSPDAEIDTKPQLEIFADDVKCTHGATVGQLDENQLFYLRARGVEEPMARALLTYAFASDIVEGVGLDSLRRWLEGLLLARMPEGERIKELI
ncbi:cysteine desulfurase activator complex subunit SufB [Caballeronia arvi]|uniref:Cysteine desulfurase activator complex subunit SufB n=1 Tax=Caballeronia arvi TaxID=1777135 RepID=A0A158KX73_9BURK|nr:Fe-S cluster assembly protein SufD [Caballeronia arvi]SAL85768.1 cysteine desulfurase activator complex subunit SufB [Caballeronia arvi]